MIFCRYAGVGKEFTLGKVYPARPEMNGTSTVGFDFVEVINDDGDTIRERPEDGNWEFLDEVYAVVVEPVREREVGEVVIVSDMSADATMFFIKGSGLFRRDSLALLDKTNVFLGMIVMDVSTGFWVPVRRTDECLWVMVSEGSVMRSPEEFRFAVAESDHEIITEPIARCVDVTGYPNLILNNLYRVQRIWEEIWVVIDDEGLPVDCDAGRFRMGS